MKVIAGLSIEPRRSTSVVMLDPVLQAFGVQGIEPACLLEFGLIAIVLAHQSVIVLQGLIVKAKAQRAHADIVVLVFTAILILVGLLEVVNANWLLLMSLLMIVNIIVFP